MSYDGSANYLCNKHLYEQRGIIQAEHNEIIYHTGAFIFIALRQFLMTNCQLIRSTMSKMFLMNSSYLQHMQKKKKNVQTRVCYFKINYTTNRLADKGCEVPHIALECFKIHELTRFVESLRWQQRKQAIKNVTINTSTIIQNVNNLSA